MVKLRDRFFVEVLNLKYIFCCCPEQKYCTRNSDVIRVNYIRENIFHYYLFVVSCLGRGKKDMVLMFPICKV